MGDAYLWWVHLRALQGLLLVYMFTTLSRSGCPPIQVRLGVAVVPGENCATAPPPAGRRHLRLSYVIDESEYDAGLAKVCERK